MSKDTIVIFIGGYLPGKKYGGPVTSLENFANQLHEKYKIKIICSDHDFKDPIRYQGIHDGWNTVGNAEVFYTNERDYDSYKFEKIIEPFADRVKLLYLSGIYYIQMNYAVFKMAKRKEIPVLLAPRGDLMKNTIAMKSKAKMIKKLVFLKASKLTGIFNGIYFQSTSQEETDGLKHYLGITDDRIFELPNLPVKQHKKVDYNKEANKVKVVFISRLMVKKNPLVAIKAVGEISETYNVCLDIYGPIEDEDYWKQCTDEIDRINASKKNVSINYKGSLSPDKAKRIYDSYDCFLFPTSSENYGHVIVEAMFSDCPVVLSLGTTPWDDYNQNGGYTASLDHLSEFADAIEDIASMDQEKYNALIQRNRNYVEKKFKIEELKQKYVDMIEGLSKE